MDTLTNQDDDLEQKFDDLCLDLNMDALAKESAWENYLNIKENYTLEGNGLHWLACALYVSCRKTVMPTVGSGNIEGNGVSLTRLIRSSQLSLLEFFKKMKKWLDMATLPQEFRDKIERLERNFAVSTVIFKKFKPIFLDIFNDPANDPPQPPRSRKQRRLPCTATEVFNYCWTTFVQVKGNFPAISDDLVNSYHLLLCCIDWFFANALTSNRRDLLRQDFPGLPENYMDKEYRAPSEVPCIIQLLCEKHEGLVVEAKGIKEHWWKPYIKKLFDKKTLRGRADNLTGILEIGNFESNSKEINKAYEEYVLSVGDFDERIFLGEDADIEIGTPAKIGAGPTIHDGFYDRLGAGGQSLQQHVMNTRSLCPPTPLTGRRWLKENAIQITPVSTATQSVGKLQTLLAGRKTTPSDTLFEMFKLCSQNPTQSITSRIKDMGELFCNKYVQSSDEHPGSHIDFARKRLQLAESLYYKTLENIMLDEKHRYDAKKQPCDFTGILGQDIFHRSLFACCLEIVIFSYNSQRAFPWILEVYDLPAYSFYKVIEVLIKVEEGLSRDVVKHLNRIEESVLEQLAWKESSPLWEVIRNEPSIPSFEEVSFPNQIERDEKAGSGTGEMVSIISPMINPALRRVAAVGGIPTVYKDVPQSPTSAAERFTSPGGGAKRRLFGITQEHGSHVLVSNKPSEKTAEMRVSNGGTHSTSSNSSQNLTASKPRKTGSLALFLRKVYHLASVRLRDLCERLEVDSTLRSMIWTCFEHALVHHIELIEERHLDQIIMCTMYVICKVTGNDRSFQDIMKCYRHQPQAHSHVYRSVLLTSRRRPASAGSDSDKNNGSGSNSPNSEERERRRAERLANIRSDSALPVPQPDSHPPTPTRMIGSGNSFEYSDRGEDRGDLIKFYNSVYVIKVKEFALKFSKMRRENNELPPLSPLPVVRPHSLSPRRVSQKHSVYVSPHKQTPLTPHTKLLYCFSRSPAKDLRAINNMLRLNDKSQSTMKRLALSAIDPTHEGSAAKRICSPMFAKRLESVVLDRQQGSAAANAVNNHFNK